MSASHRARERLSSWVRAEPWRTGYWRAVDESRAGATWPAYAYLPLEEAGRIVARAWHSHGHRPGPGDLVREAATLQGLAAWRVTQGIYRFDETLREALVSTPMTGDLPADTLLRLPEWAVYVETPGLTTPTVAGPDTPLVGCYAWLDWAATTAQPSLVLGLDVEAAEGLSVSVIPLARDTTLESAIREVARQWMVNHALGLAAAPPPERLIDASLRTLPPILSLLLYLCAENRDLGGAQPVRPQPTRTRRGPRIFPPDAPRIWDVGARLGAAVRRGYDDAERDWQRETASGRAPPRPHWRRAHWQLRWRGPRDPARASERTPVVYWQPPSLVAARGETAEVPATIHRVRRDP